MKLYRVDINNQGQRLNKYLCRILSAAPQSFVYKMLRKKNITLNEKKAEIQNQEEQRATKHKTQRRKKQDMDIG